MIAVHGTKDELVPYRLSEELCAKVKAAGVECELMTIPDAPHTPTAHMADILKNTAAFLARRVPAR